MGIYNLNKTYNKALKLSKGDLVAILEGDDFWPSQKLETQIKAFEDPEVGLCWGKVQMIDNDNNFIETRPNNIELYQNISKTSLIEKLLVGNFIPACTVICRKASLLNIGGFQQPLDVPYVDYPTWLELSLNEKFRAFNDDLGCWRRHEDQMSTSKLLEMITTSEFSIEFYKKLGKDIKNSINLTTKDLEQNYKLRIAFTSFDLGRKNLISKEYEEGKKNFKRAIIKGPILLKAKSLLGLICAYSKTDLEGIAGRLDRPLYREYS